MSNIEETKMTDEAFNELIDNFEIVGHLTEYGRKAIKQKIKEMQAKIKELEEENLHWRGRYHLLSRKIDVIPKQKVKDVLQNNRNEIFSFTYVDDEQFKPYTMQIDRINKKEKELLEEGE